jgi:hypothetical protein
VLEPEALEVGAARAADRERRHVARLEDLEAGGQDHDVERPAVAVGGAHAVGVNVSIGAVSRWTLSRLYAAR